MPHLPGRTTGSWEDGCDLPSGLRRQLADQLCADGRAAGSEGDGRGLNPPPRHWLLGRRARPQSAAAPLAPKETGAASICRRAAGS